MPRRGAAAAPITDSDPYTLRPGDSLLVLSAGPSAPHSNVTGLRREPMFSIETVTVSPCRRYTAGSLVYPTPLGVPVSSKVPGSNVVHCDANEISEATPKIMSLVEDSCISCSFRTVLKRRPLGSMGLCSFVRESSRNGPVGVNVSKLLARAH